MKLFVRIDDRLLHGQVLEAWVPYLIAHSVLVASDEIAGAGLQSALIKACHIKDVDVTVMGVEEALKVIVSDGRTHMTMLVIVGSLTDAMRLYEGGARFDSLNIGNVHHRGGGRVVTPSVELDSEDEDIIKRLRSAGVEVEIRTLPSRPSVRYDAG